MPEATRSSKLTSSRPRSLILIVALISPRLSRYTEVNIPRLAEGGIVTRSILANVGEAGPEAVIPLDKMAGMGGNTFNIYVQAQPGDDREQARRVGYSLMNTLKQQIQL